MLLIRIYILAGLMVHKLVWEVFKRQRGGSPRSRSADPAGLRIIRLVKIGVLLGIAVQTRRTATPRFIRPRQCRHPCRIRPSHSPS